MTTEIVVKSGERIDPVKGFNVLIRKKGGLFTARIGDGVRGEILVGGKRVSLDDYRERPCHTAGGRVIFGEKKISVGPEMDEVDDKELVVRWW